MTLIDCKNILIVEDDRAIRQIMSDVLELNGYNTFIAGDGEEALQALKAMQFKPCVVLLDLMMPGTNGWQFLAAQRNDPQFASIPIIVCSAYKESAKAVQPAAFIEKPVQLDSLLGTIKTFCA